MIPSIVSTNTTVYVNSLVNCIFYFIIFEKFVWNMYNCAWYVLD